MKPQKVTSPRQVESERPEARALEQSSLREGQVEERPTFAPSPHTAMTSAHSLDQLRVAADAVFEEVKSKGYKPFVLFAAIDTATKLTLALYPTDVAPTPWQLRDVLLKSAARATEATSRTRAERARQSLIAALAKSVD